VSADLRRRLGFGLVRREPEALQCGTENSPKISNANRVVLPGFLRLTTTDKRGDTLKCD
jgi:hypothetical protein